MLQKEKSAAIMMEEEIMFKVNDNYQKLPGSYLFSTIAKKVSAFSQANPDKILSVLELVT